jgi:hypothetical protein
MKRNKLKPHNKYSFLHLYFFILTIINFLYFFNTVEAKSLLKTNKSTSDKDNPFAGMSDAELDKMMKEYGLDSKDLGISKKSSSSNSSSSGSGKIKKSSFDMNLDEDPLAMLEISNSHKSPESSSPKKIKEIYSKNKEILKKFELSEKDAYSLITQVSKFQIFNKLPLTAMNIIKESKSQKSYIKISKKDTLNKNDETNTNMLISNTLNSQVFIDHENKVGRKGMLSLVNKDTAEVKNVWAVLNSRVFCLYKSSNYLNILKIYRISMLKIKDFIYSPCFFLYYGENGIDSEEEGDKNLKNLNLNKNKIKTDSEKDMLSLSSLSNRNNVRNENSSRSLNFANFKNSQSLICALNFREKDYWLKLINYHKDQYKN